MPVSHTPGPWIADAWYVGPKDLPTLVTINPNGPVGSEELHANARLIAAAPDLLAALQKLVRAIDRLPGNNPLDGLADEARDAIAKATGA